MQNSLFHHIVFWTCLAAVGDYVQYLAPVSWQFLVEFLAKVREITHQPYYDAEHNVELSQSR